MKAGQAAIDIEASPDVVWAYVGRFDGVEEWMPGVDSCQVTGHDRLVEAGDLSVTERLFARDETGRMITYALVAGMPVEHHRATITVVARGKITHVTWAVEVSPDDFVEVLVAHYQRALTALKARVEADPDPALLE